MVEALVITPVKDSLDTLKNTIQAITNSNGNFRYIIYNDFSSSETKEFLESNKKEFNFEVVHLEDLTKQPSPNYKLALQLAQNEASPVGIPLIIIESDVIVKSNTIAELIHLSKSKENPGMIGAITVDRNGNYNFPYEYEKIKSNDVVNTHHSLSFCCTLLNTEFLKQFDFSNLSSKKDWFDVFLSRQSKKMGYNNFLAKNLEVLHLPHSSRPWKKLKYSNPVKYYISKYLKKRDRI